MCIRDSYNKYYRCSWIAYPSDIVYSTLCANRITFTYNSNDNTICEDAKHICTIFPKSILPYELEDVRRRGGGIREDEFFNKPLNQIEPDVYSYTDIGTLYPFPYLSVGLIQLSEKYEELAKTKLIEQNPTASSDDIREMYINILNKTLFNYNAYGTYYVVTDASGEYLTSTIQALKKIKE